MTREPRPALLRERGAAGEQITQDGEIVGVGRVVWRDAEQRGEVGEVDERDQGHTRHRRRRERAGSTAFAIANAWRQLALRRVVRSPEQEPPRAAAAAPRRRPAAPRQVSSTTDQDDAPSARAA